MLTQVICLRCYFFFFFLESQSIIDKVLKVPIMVERKTSGQTLLPSMLQTVAYKRKNVFHIVVEAGRL